MTDDEIAELLAENARLRAMTETASQPDDAVTIVQAPEPEPVAAQVAVIAAHADAQVAVIAAEADAEVAVIAAQADAEADAEPDTDSDNGELFAPESDSWYFRRWGKSK
jgi:hypothetical protein